MEAWEKEKVLELAEENNVSFIRLQFTDMFGTLKNIAMTVNQLERALEGRMTVNNPSINQYCRLEESNMYLRPDPSTFVIFPWRPREGAVARLICDLEGADEKPFPGCVRTVLKKTIREAEQLGFSVTVSSKAKFFLFYLDEKGKPTTLAHDTGSKFDLTPLDLGENARREIILNLEDMGFEIETSHHELSPGQHEINFSGDHALIAADNIVTYKYVIRTLAQKHGLHATFMPKPLRNYPGSGMSLQLMLFKNEKNAFVDEKAPDNKSDTLKYFIGGILRHAPALGALANPTVNSYKRLINDEEVYNNIAAWSESSLRSALRVPMTKQETFVEWQTPDGSCNPYLVIAGALKAGLDGIKNNILPPAPLNIAGEKLSKNKIEELQIKQLPMTLEDSLDALEKDPVIQQTLGSYISRHYVAAKRLEVEDYMKEVHGWELEHYLTKY